MTSSLAPAGPRSTRGETSATPGASATAVRTASSFPSSLTTTLVGALEPAGKPASISSCPWTESTSSRNMLPVVRSLLRKASPAAITTSSAVVPTQTRRGARATHSAIRRQAPCVSSVPSLPTRGMKGQKARRPKIVSRAGRMVSIETIAIAMPIAPIGPRPEVPLTSASDSVSSAAITVAPEARMTGLVRRSVTRMASCLSSCRRSSSR